MLRASVHPADMSLPLWPGDSAGPEPWCSWLAAVWARPQVAHAAALASPHLADRIEAMLTGSQPGERQARRMALALAQYLVRMRGRATPFGTFAGVTATSFGSHTQLRWSEDHCLHIRADAAWLADVTAQLEACAPLLRRLPVTSNDLATECGGRLIVPWQPHQSTPVGGSQDETQVSVRLVPVVETIRREARSPIRTDDLIDKAAIDHPGASRQALEAAVGQLVTAGVLISSLRAPSTVTDALGHLVTQLDAAGADDLPEIKPLAGALREVHRRVNTVSAVRHGESGRRGTAQQMRALSTAADQPLAVDLRLGCTVVLPHAVAAEAAAAAEVLIRLSPVRTASESWRAYHGAFLARYGPGALVPVEELTDPVAGLGLPSHFTQPPAARGMTHRDEALLALAQQAALDDQREIVLDDAALARIVPANAEGRRPVSPADLWADLRAETPAALDKGAFTLSACGFGRTAATTGRFLPLLDEADRCTMTGLYASQPPSVQGALAAQLSFPPQHARIENVLRVPPVLPHVISLAEHREPSDNSHLSVADLAVAADTTRLYVISRSRQRVVEPMLPHAGARHTLPPLARLLFEIPRSVHPAVTPFDWGTASCLPYLPRVRYGRSILAPAQWHLDPADLPGPDAPGPEWSAALDHMRESRCLPASLAAGSGDRRLRLDLHEPMDRSVLRAHLEAADGPVTLTEAPSAADHGWCGGRAHEVVIPLAATTLSDPAPVFLTGSAPLPVTHLHDRVDVVYAKLYGQPEEFDAILATHLPTLLQRWHTPPQWWFARYRHPAPHLRLRLHDPDYARASGHLATWAADLRREGLLAEIAFDTYSPETGRYGTGTAMAAAEELFAADSTAVLAQLTWLSTNRDIHPQALTAASLVDLAAAVTGSRVAGMRWLLDRPEHADGAGPQDRNLRRQTLRLADPKVLANLPGGTAIGVAWESRAEAAARYTALLTRETTRVTPHTVLGSLLHMHYVRARRTDQRAEAATYKLARAVALAQARPPPSGTCAR